MVRPLRCGLLDERVGECRRRVFVCVCVCCVCVCVCLFVCVRVCVAHSGHACTSLPAAAGVGDECQGARPGGHHRPRLSKKSTTLYGSRLRPYRLPSLDSSSPPTFHLMRPPARNQRQNIIITTSSTTSSCAHQPGTIASSSPPTFHPLRPPARNQRPPPPAADSREDSHPTTHHSPPHPMAPPWSSHSCVDRMSSGESMSPAVLLCMTDRSCMGWDARGAGAVKRLGLPAGGRVWGRSPCLVRLGCLSAP